jgi:hypothetical protein
MRSSPSLLALLLPCLATAAVETYPRPTDERWLSGRYTVSVRQGDTPARPSFVYESTNPFHAAGQAMGEANHWTTFSFDGSVEVTITLPAAITPLSARVLPSAFGIAATIDGQRVRFTLDRPRQVALEINGDRRQPLFLFAKEPERDRPDLAAANVIDFSKRPSVHNDPTRPNVLYFPPGEYDLVELGYELNKGFPLDAGDTVYIAGGAVVHGAFSSQAENVTVRGRGIVSGAKWRWVRERYQEAGIPWDYGKYREVAVYLHGARSRVEDVTFTDPVHFCVSTGDDSLVRGIQCFGWWYTTDGVRAGDRSVVEDCFFKVNDDVVKLYCHDLVVRRCLIWAQMNGAPFQLTWNLRGPVRGARVSDCIIMASEVSSDRELMGNRSVVNSRLNMGAEISDFVFERIRVEGDVYRLLGLHIGQAGTIRDLTLRDIEITGRLRYFNYLNATGGVIRDIRLENLRVGGRRLTTLDEFVVVERGEVTGVTLR